MSEVQTAIADKLNMAFLIQHCELINESYKHNVPPDSETHFKLVMVSEDFAGKAKVARHQAVYKCLADELAGPVHALALHLYTADEWDAKKVPNSPACRGGEA